MMQIEMRGLKRVQNLMAQLPANLNKEIMNKSDDFMRFVQKSAKLRAPRFTGQLAESIIVKRNKSNEIILRITSPYGWFQEHGFTGKFLPASMPVQGGYTIWEWMNARGMRGIGIKPSGIPHPFIAPALEAGLSNLPNMLKNATKQAIKNSRK